MRELHLTNPEMRGDDVKEAQAELIKHDWLHPSINDGIFGPETAHACKHGKYVLGFPTNLIKGTYGEYFNGVLHGTIRVPLSWRIRARQRRSAVITASTREQRLRAAIVAEARWGIANKNSINYDQIRPIEWPTRHLPIKTDCSGYVTDCYRWAGAPDPNGEGYNGEGYTGTALNHMRHISLSALKPADVIVYGAYPGDHEVLVLEPGTDPLVASNGSEPDPNEMRHSVLVAAISSYVTCLTLPAW